MDGRLIGRVKRFWHAARLLSSSSMSVPFIRLPLEVTEYIFVLSARILASCDRHSVVQLALVSRRVYRLVRPSLYRALVIGKANVAKFSCADLYVPILPYARYIWVGDIYDDKDQKIVLGLLELWRPPRGANAFLEAPVWIISGLFRSNPEGIPGLTGLRPTYTSLEEILNGRRALSEPVRNTVTHLVGSLPRAAVFDDSDSPSDWAKVIRSAVPYLTHIGLRIVVFGEPALPEVCLRLEGILRALLDYHVNGGKGSEEAPQLKCVCLRLLGCLTADTWRNEAALMTARINDNRLKVWIDDRLNEYLDGPYALGSGYEAIRILITRPDVELDVEDGKAGWKFWNPEERPNTVVLKV